MHTRRSFVAIDCSSVCESRVRACVLGATDRPTAEGGREGGRGVVYEYRQKP
jgi:hypothetical protein